MVYYIAEDKFLCHSDNRLHSTDELICERAYDWEAKAEPGKKVPNMNRLGETRAYLFFNQKSQIEKEKGAYNFSWKRFWRQLPHHKESVEDETEK
jgi:hypothetical protein